MRCLLLLAAILACSVHAVVQAVAATRRMNVHGEPLSICGLDPLTGTMLVILHMHISILNTPLLPSQGTIAVAIAQQMHQTVAHTLCVHKSLNHFYAIQEHRAMTSAHHNHNTAFQVCLSCVCVCGVGGKRRAVRDVHIVSVYMCMCVCVYVCMCM